MIIQPVLTAGKSDTTQLPAFTYSGSYTTEFYDNGDWKIKFLSSGTLTFSALGGAEKGIDVFLVGGGGSGHWNCGGGGGGGYTATHRKIYVQEKEDYKITIGAGGAKAGWGESGKKGGDTSAFDYTVSGGNGGSKSTGSGDGGSGGGGGAYGNAGAGGSDGGDGEKGGYGPGGLGQGTTTREFGDPDGTLYAGGGGGGSDSGSGGAGGDGGGGRGNTSTGVAGTKNTGGGGGSGGYEKGGAAGGSGIVIIRAARK